MLLAPVTSMNRSKSFQFDRLAMSAVRGTGSSVAFALATVTVVVWAAAGPAFGFSETWQLVINTSTTIVTFLMVFLIQHAQNKDSDAIHLKLNELLAAQPGASNRLIAGEELDERTIERLKEHYRHLVELSAKAEEVSESHSIEEAVRRHRDKRRVADD